MNYIVSHFGKIGFVSPLKQEVIIITDIISFLKLQMNLYLLANAARADLQKSTGRSIDGLEYHFFLDTLFRRTDSSVMHLAPAILNGSNVLNLSLIIISIRRQSFLFFYFADLG